MEMITTIIETGLKPFLPSHPKNDRCFRMCNGKLILFDSYEIKDIKSLELNVKLVNDVDSYLKVYNKGFKRYEPEYFDLWVDWIEKYSVTN